ncbi:MAG: TIGR03546 family protein [Candidatus Omnitrophota bacterium]
MFSFVNIPARILSILQLNISPAEVAAGVCLGMFLGFTPLNGPMALVLLIFFFLFKINRFSTAITLPLFKMLYLFGASFLAERIGGYLLLDADFLTGFWQQVTSMPVLALADLNNTLVTGGLALSIVLCIPVYLLAKFIYVKFIGPRLNKIQESELAKRIKRYKFVNNVIKQMDIIRSRTSDKTP